MKNIYHTLEEIFDVLSDLLFETAAQWHSFGCATVHSLELPQNDSIHCEENIRTLQLPNMTLKFQLNKRGCWKHRCAAEAWNNTNIKISLFNRHNSDFLFCFLNVKFTSYTGVLQHWNVSENIKQLLIFLSFFWPHGGSGSCKRNIVILLPHKVLYPEQVSKHIQQTRSKFTLYGVVFLATWYVN